MSLPTSASAPASLASDRSTRTPAQQAASRANGARSRGPTTPEGRRRCRRNALRHGCSGAGVVVPDALEHEARAEADAYARVLHPRDALERRLVETAALANVRWSWLARAANERTIDQVRSAVERWDARRAADVAAAAAPLEAPNGQDPAAAVAVLRRTAEGCDWLADAWLDLREALETSGGWSGPQSARAARLLGRAVPGPRDEDSAFWRAFWAAVRACRPAAAPPAGRRAGMEPGQRAKGTGHEPGDPGHAAGATGHAGGAAGHAGGTAGHAGGTAGHAGGARGDAGGATARAPRNSGRAAHVPTESPPSSSALCALPSDLWLSPSSPTPNDDLDYLLELCQAQIDALVERGDRLWEQIDGPSRAEAPGRALFDDSPEGARLARYLADAERAGRRALADLRRLQRGPAEAHAAPVPAPEPARVEPAVSTADEAPAAPEPAELVATATDPTRPRRDASPAAPASRPIEPSAPRRETNLAPAAPADPTRVAEAPEWLRDIPDPVVQAA